MKDGHYYLHTNGELIYKPGLGTSAADLRESDFVRMYWPIDTDDRESLWTILVEAGALGANPEQIAELAAKWMATDQDADEYAKRVNCMLLRDGTQWAAHRHDFRNLQEYPAGFGSTKLEAMIQLAMLLDLKPNKLRWGPTFQTLLK